MGELLLDWRRKNDWDCCVAIKPQLGDYMLKMSHEGYDHLDYVSVLSRGVVTFHDLAEGAADSVKRLAFFTGFLQLNEGENRIVKFSQIQDLTVTGNYSVVLHPSNTFCDRPRE